MKTDGKFNEQLEKFNMDHNRFASGSDDEFYQAAIVTQLATSVGPSNAK